MRTVYIGITHDNDFVIPQFFDIERAFPFAIANAGSDGGAALRQRIEIFQSDLDARDPDGRRARQPYDIAAWDLAATAAGKPVAAAKKSPGARTEDPRDLAALKREARRLAPAIMIVRDRGDEALSEMTSRYDGYHLTGDEIAMFRAWVRDGAPAGMD